MKEQFICWLYPVLFWWYYRMIYCMHIVNNTEDKKLKRWIFSHITRPHFSGSLLVCANERHFQRLWGKGCLIHVRATPSPVIDSWDFQEALSSPPWIIVYPISATPHLLTQRVLLSLHLDQLVLFPRSPHKKLLMDDCVQEGTEFNVSLNKQEISISSYGGGVNYNQNHEVGCFISYKMKRYWKCLFRLWYK